MRPNVLRTKLFAKIDFYNSGNRGENSCHRTSSCIFVSCLRKLCSSSLKHLISCCRALISCCLATHREFTSFHNVENDNENKRSTCFFIFTEQFNASENQNEKKKPKPRFLVSRCCCSFMLAKPMVVNSKTFLLTV